MRRKNTTKQMMKEYMAESLLLLLEKKNYDTITIREITDKAGVNRTTYYRNFSAKEDIVLFFYQKIMLEYLSAYQEQPQKTMNAYLTILFQCFFQYQKQLLLLYKNGLAHLLLKALNVFFQRQIVEKLPPEEHFKVFFHIGGIYNFFILWFAHNMAESPETLVNISLSLLPAGTRPMLAVD